MKATAQKAKTKKPKAKEDPAKIELPDHINREAWVAFVDMRKRIKKPMSVNAAKLALNGLERLRQDGDEPNLVLQQSDYHNWQSVYPLKPGFLQLVGKNRDGSPRVQQSMQHVQQGRANRTDDPEFSKF